MPFNKKMAMSGYFQDAVMQVFSNVWEKCQPFHIIGAIQIELCKIQLYWKLLHNK